MGSKAPVFDDTHVPKQSATGSQAFSTNSAPNMPTLIHSTDSTATAAGFDILQKTTLRRIKDLEETNAGLANKLDTKRQRVGVLIAERDDQKTHISTLDNKITRLEGQKTELEKAKRDADQKGDKLKHDIESSNKKIEELEKDFSAYQKQANEHAKYLDQEKTKTNNLDTLLKEARDTLTYTREDLQKSKEETEKELHAREAADTSRTLAWETTQHANVEARAAITRAEEAEAELKRRDDDLEMMLQGNNSRKRKASSAPVNVPSGPAAKRARLPTPP